MFADAAIMSRVGFYQSHNWRIQFRHQCNGCWTDQNKIAHPKG